MMVSTHLLPRLLVTAAVLTAVCAPLTGATDAIAYEIIDVDDGGSITGTVHHDGGDDTAVFDVDQETDVCGDTIEIRTVEVDKHDGLRHAVVFIEQISAGAAIDKTHRHRLRIEHCVIEPRLIAVGAGQVLELTNADPFMHALAGMRGDQVAFSANLPIQGMKIDKREFEPGIIHLRGADGQPWMNAWIYVVGHPYYTLTDKKGRFTIRRVPPGDYRLTAWHPQIGSQSIEIHVVEDEKTEVSFDALSPATTDADEAAGDDADEN
jgi:hypothetical protein